MDTIDLPEDVKHRFELLDKLALATIEELRGRKLHARDLDAQELSKKLQAQCIREDLDMEGVDIETVEKEKDEISDEVDRNRSYRDFIRDDLCLYQESQRSLPDVDWTSLQSYSREVINRIEEMRTVLLRLTRDDHILLKRKQDKEDDRKKERAKIHPILNDLDSIRDRLENICRLFRLRKAAKETSPAFSQPASCQALEKASSPTVPEEISSPLPSTHIQVPMADEALYYRYQKMIADAGSLHEGRAADELRFSALELDFTKAMNEVEHDADPLPPSLPQPKPPTMEEIGPLVKALAEEQFKAIPSLPLHRLKSEVLLHVNAVHIELAEKMAEANRLLCNILVESPSYIREEGELETSSSRLTATISEQTYH